jgi:SAM-dependent methyltransferase
MSHDSFRKSAKPPRSWRLNRYASQRVGIWRQVRGVLPSAPNPGALALDVGPGQRPFHPLIQSAGYEVIGVDRAPIAEVCGEAERLPFTTDSFSLVTCVNVLQYVDDPAVAISEQHRVLEKDGFLVLCAPAFQPLDPLDKWRWTAHSLKQLCIGANLEVLSVRSTTPTISTILHLVALGIRQKIPLLGGLLAMPVEVLALAALKGQDDRFPIANVVLAQKK